jgi:murein DD-endopeptidase MepM/ murein hydrolase activator NlpD
MVVKIGNTALVSAALVLLVLARAGAAEAWAWPVEGQVLRPFVADGDPYAGGQHRGIDIASASGSDVRAPVTGVVSYVGRLPHEGLCLTIRTEDGYSVTLVHLGAGALPVGTAVAEAEVVGTVGPSGEPEGPEPYVHLGVRLTADPNGYVDPLPLLPAREGSSGPPTAPPAAPPAPPASLPAVLRPKREAVPRRA